MNENDTEWLKNCRFKVAKRGNKIERYRLNWARGRYQELSFSWLTMHLNRRK